MLKYTEYQSQKSNVSKLIFLLHGYGSNKDDLISIAPELAQYIPDALFISPNAPEILEDSEYMAEAYQWFSLKDRAEEKMLNGAKKASVRLESFILDQIKKFNLSLHDIALIGFSQGAMMAMHLGLRLQHQIRGIIGYSGLLIAPSKLKEEIISRPPIALIHGIEDNVVSIIEMDKAKRAFDDNAITSYTHRCKMLAHGIDYDGIKFGGNFLHKVFF